MVGFNALFDAAREFTLHFTVTQSRHCIQSRFHCRCLVTASNGGLFPFFGLSKGERPMLQASLPNWLLTHSPTYPPTRQSQSQSQSHARLTVSQAVCIDVEPLLVLITICFLLFDDTIVSLRDAISDERSGLSMLNLESLLLIIRTPQNNFPICSIIVVEETRLFEEPLLSNGFSIFAYLTSFPSNGSTLHNILRWRL
jgi:hypothetical protein